MSYLIEALSTAKWIAHQSHLMGVFLIFGIFGQLYGRLRWAPLCTVCVPCLFVFISGTMRSSGHGLGASSPLITTPQYLFSECSDFMVALHVCSFTFDDLMTERVKQRPHFLADVYTPVQGGVGILIKRGCRGDLLAITVRGRSHRTQARVLREWARGWVRGVFNEEEFVRLRTRGAFLAAPERTPNVIPPSQPTAAVSPLGHWTLTSSNSLSHVTT
jgi:hypothetical protein